MEINYFVNVRLPTEKAHGRQIVKMCQALAEQGATVKLFLPTRHNKITETVFAYYQVPPIFSVRYLPTVDPVWLQHGPAGLYSQIQGRLFARSIKKFLADQAGSPENILFTRDELLLKTLQLYSRRVVWEGHKWPRHPQFYRAAWRRCFKLVTNTAGLKEELVAQGLPADKILALPNGVDLAVYQLINSSQSELRQNLQLPLADKIILYAGQLYNWKGVEVLAQAAAAIKGTVVVVGGLGQELSDFQRQFGQLANLKIIGQQPAALIPQYLAAADVLVLPNSGKFLISQKHTSPLKLFEYLAAGRPIVASDLPSIREIVSAAEVSFFPPDQPAALAQVVNEVLADYSAAQQRAGRASELIKNYTWSSRASRLLDWLK